MYHTFRRCHGKERSVKQTDVFGDEMPTIGDNGPLAFLARMQIHVNVEAILGDFTPRVATIFEHVKEAIGILRFSGVTTGNANDSDVVVEGSHGC